MSTLKSKIGAILLPMLPVNRRTFDVLRYELQAQLTCMTNALNPLYHVKVHRLHSRRDLSLNVGSGGRGLPGWVNVELVRMRDTTLCLDVRRRLPFADGSVARLLAEHVVEHMDFRADVPAVFADWHRILKAGGVLRIIVPDAKRFLEAYVDGDASLWSALGWDLYDMPADIFTPMHIVNHVFHQSGEHLFGYDFETLAWALHQAGFRTVEQMSYRRSHDPDLAIDQENHAPYSLYVEAVKE
jgi:predicted SAM-dependent methyltransferase